MFSKKYVEYSQNFGHPLRDLQAIAELPLKGEMQLIKSLNISNLQLVEKATMISWNWRDISAKESWDK